MAVVSAIAEGARRDVRECGALRCWRRVMAGARQRQVRHVALY